MAKIIIHADYGGGFGTSVGEDKRMELVTNSTLIYLLERLTKTDNLTEIEVYFEEFHFKVAEILGEKGWRVRISNLCVQEIPDDARFYITEYDGRESVIHDKMPQPWW